MSRPRIKICGITRPQDAALAVECGADAIGMIFVPESRRYLRDLGLAREIAQQACPVATPVALFFNASPQQVEAVLQQLPDVVLQFQGDEPAAWCEQFARPYIKGIRMAPELKPQEQVEEYHSACALLFDSWQQGVSGGTGQVFDWQRLPTLPEGRRWFLAGGLDAGNIADAVRHRPWGLDLASGVEAAPGVKDERRMRDFFAAVAGVDG